ASATVGTGPINLTVDGTAFAAGATVRWALGNQTQNLTNVQFVSAARLTATIPAALLTTAGTAQVSMANTTGPASNSVPFTVNPLLVTIRPSVVVSPTDQPTLNVTLAAPVTTPLNGTLVLTFTPNGVPNLPSGYIDSALVF